MMKPKDLLLGLVFVITVIGLSAGVFFFQRWFHYKLSYQAYVIQEIQPLTDRVTQLEQQLHEHIQFKGGSSDENEKEK